MIDATRRLGLIGLLVAAAALAPRGAAAQAAQDCPRGTLDARFCDRDGDLVADTPTDPGQLVDPSVLVFAYTPVEDPAVYRSVWQGFMDHLAKATGKRVQFFAVQSNAAQIEAMRAGRLHVAGFNTGSNPLAVNCAGFVPFAMMASREGEFGYNMEIIVPADSPVQRIEDLKGRTIAFTAPTSNSGFKAPSALLASQFNMLAERDFKPAFSGRHDNSIIGVANKDYDAAAIANSVMARMVARNAVDPARIRSIYRSPPFPTTGYGHVYNLRPELQAKIREAFFSFPWDGSALLAEFQKSQPPQEKFIPITYKEHWAVVRDIDKAMNVSYACR
ncbi:phosphate/phosphite/phosphonate ABC transporter substrate-binding protein [Elioraea sp. Yellowstone]|jgi:phosphonate transport system substrate-binding protein|uniref:phosphate/phosphite/phosphonate ABC transporter substrate-binding protein n=1 Tax=Elioraea sp. Yellowstone TaxID=2592070 RepID=UPI00114ED05C|nr:phosphate/phosphite/phosphonate ABC transporter substrate-binding protein [Elioraea sp. Yellowstone]TQF77962.1 phosphate/phosphite/phosphonate ABC transporter substrate-binding protein [Elioraea sp. Yellowstone]